MRIGLDTSVLLRLLIGQPEVLAASALAALRELRHRGTMIAVSDLVLAETYFALQHHYSIPKGAALGRLRQFVESPEIKSSSEALEVLATRRLGSAKPGFVDRLIHAEYSRSCDGMITFERSAGRLSGTTVLGA